MKRIAIFQDNLDVGGIQKSLVNLLRNFDYADYHVDLYLSQEKTFWDVDFPPELNVFHLKHIPRICSFMPFDIARKLVKLDFSGVEEYDVAIDFNSYQFSCALGALTVPAKRRVMWIHNNVGVKLKNEWKYRVLWYNFKGKFKYYDEFVGVSNGVIEPFKEASGYYDKKYTVIQNTIDTNEIFIKAAEETDFSVDESKFNFVALGRICHQKGYDIMLDVFARACEKRDDLHLYIIGDGDKRFFIEYQRDSLGLTDKVTLLGQKKNPFKYMDKMDAFLSTSRYEGQPLNIMEAKALGLPLYCTKNLEIYSEGLVGRENIEEAIVSAKKTEKTRDDLHEYNGEIIRRVKALAEERAGEGKKARGTMHIIALHLGTGGVEKAIVNMANMFSERYRVIIHSVYRLPGSPAFELRDKIEVRYLLDDIPNREEWWTALRKFNVTDFVAESVRAVKILLGKRAAVIRTIRAIKDGIIITTRNEDNVRLSRYGAKEVLKLAQLHHDHGFERKYINAFKYRYGRIDIFALLTPQLADEVRAIMKGRNRHTEVVYIPNFIDSFPDSGGEERGKIVVAAGRLARVKRFNLLIREFISIHEAEPDWKLIIFGDGAEKPALEKQIADAGAGDYIELPGVKNSDELQKEMLKASIFAMTSRSEGFGFVLIEAQSCGLPPVAYDVRVGPGFVIHDGQDGYLVPEGDNELFESRMRQLMESRALRDEMSERARIAAREFSKENVAKMWYSVIDNEE